MVSVIQFVSDKTWALSLSTPLATPSQDMLREVLREHARKLKLDRWELSMAQFTMTGVGPSRWAITGEDLDTLETLARKAFKFVQPDVHMLNKWIIAPHTFLRGRLSWAVLHNLETHGLKCQTFVSHCWDEPFYEFLQALRDQYADYARRAFWVCFVANPQSWGKAALDEMLQEYVPFWTAVAECSNVLIVRNRITHIYTRGWCVLELVAAVFHRRTITVRRACTAVQHREACRPGTVPWNSPKGGERGLFGSHRGPRILWRHCPTRLSPSIAANRFWGGCRTPPPFDIVGGCRRPRSGLRLGAG
mmetsp:Transcript_88808/g.237640  ORF Transcript_88808/g.237640 Transcript_88808/m.237640 type:complete len:305 (-) Transcript_88808:403-1317(-)